MPTTLKHRGLNLLRVFCGFGGFVQLAFAFQSPKKLRQGFFASNRDLNLRLFDLHTFILAICRFFIYFRLYIRARWGISDYAVMMMYMYRGLYVQLQ
jgi:hypothetical protein